MLSREGKQTDRGAVGAEFIGYNRRRREALLLQEFPHQPNCRPSVPAGLNQEIQDFALTVHGTPEIELPPSNYDDHLVQVPAFGRSWPPTLNPPRIGPAEFQDPSSNCLIRDVETTLGKQVLNVPIAQRETAIEPDGMLDDDRWKAVTTVGYLAHPETLKHRPCRSHAVNVTMPFFSLVGDMEDSYEGFICPPQPRDQGDRLHQAESIGRDVLHKVARSALINCWTKSDHESALMWEAYAGTEGVAVRTTFQDLKESIRSVAEATVIFGQVKYVDYPREEVPRFGWAPLFHKRIAYRGEEEVRVVLPGPPW